MFATAACVGPYCSMDDAAVLFLERLEHAVDTLATASAIEEMGTLSAPSLARSFCATSALPGAVSGAFSGNSEHGTSPIDLRKMREHSICPPSTAVTLLT